MCFLGFHVGRVHGRCRKMVQKLISTVKHASTRTFFFIRAQAHIFTLNQCLSYFHSFKPSCSNDEFDF